MLLGTPHETAGQEPMIDPDHPFYRPLWRRLLIPAVCLVWVIFELVAGEAFWAVIVGAIGAYATYKLFIEKRDPPPQRPLDTQED
ncbi:DUF3329 domain-containing protein [Rhizobium sp. NTR19]|uniref:DUF3329 domain-containing protein n=1 Tax=Neorhizobium turbinariae TaxID=2937795 RepID=A0ABT0IWG4_9HYPH|nr:DUF3329 domain-containing protein [Neorhizobium turbinariae]MCK8782208.1 DUF3329 domain-containing protein [Neorhizobium turbinariae]